MNCPKCNTETHIDSTGVTSCVSCGHRVEPYNNADLMKREVPLDVNDAGEKLQSVEDTLVERGNRYGEFANHAKLSQELKATFHYHVKQHGRPEDFTYEMNEAVDMIFHKLARIANGDPYYDDNWRDIAGYAQLVVDELGKN